MRFTTRALVLLAAAGLLSGCVVAAGAAGGYAAYKYLENQEVRSYRTTVQGAYEAVGSVLPSLGYPTPKQSVLGPTEARITAGDAKVAIAEVPGGLVNVAVSVGTFESSNNQRKAALLHERLAGRLGAPVAPAAR